MIATETRIRANPLTEPQQSSILLAIINGDSMKQWCRENKTNQAHVYATIERDKGFANLYARSKEFQAETMADKLIEVADRVLDGKQDPQAARVAADIIKWTSSKLLPKKYGDRQQIDINLEKKISILDHLDQVINVTPTLEEEG
jgi:hypothetical protein